MDEHPRRPSGTTKAIWVQSEDRLGCSRTLYRPAETEEPERYVRHGEPAWYPGLDIF